MATADLGITGVLWTDQRNFYPEPDKVARLHPGVAPFLTRLLSMPVAPTPDTEYKMFQKEANYRNQYLLINNGSGEAWDSGGTPADTNTATVDGANGIVIDSSLVNRAVEIWDSTETTKRGVALITAVNSSTEIVLTSVGNPSSQTEAIAALVDNDVLRVITSYHPEFGTAPDAYSTEPSVVYNSLFHHRTTLELSYDLANAAMRGIEGAVSKLSEYQTDKMDEHKIQLDRGLWRGYRRAGMGGVAYGADSTGATSDTFSGTHIPDTTNGRIRTTLGYFPAVERYGKREDSEDEQSYFERPMASLSLTQLIDDTLKIFQFDDDPANPGIREAFCGPAAYAFWTKFVIENMGSQVQIGDTQMGSFGYHYRQFETPNGVLLLSKVNDWYGSPYSNYMAIPSMRFLGLRRLTQSGEGTTDPGVMGYFPDIKKDNRPLLRKDEYHSHLGLDMRQVKTQVVYKLT